jgi:hypothetical protein
MIPLGLSPNVKISNPINECKIHMEVMLYRYVYSSQVRMWPFLNIMENLIINSPGQIYRIRKEKVYL